MERWNRRNKMAGAVVKSLLLEYILTIICLFVLAFILMKWKTNLKTAETGILIVYVLVSFAGGWCCGKKAEKKKFLWGALAGIVYFLSLFAVSMTGEGTFQSGLTESMTAFVLCAFGGMFGGMLA